MSDPRNQTDQSDDEFDRQFEQCLPMIEAIVKSETFAGGRVSASSVLGSVCLQLQQQRQLGDPVKRRGFLRTIVRRSIYRRLKRGDSLVSLDEMDLDVAVFDENETEEQEQHSLVNQFLTALPEDLRQIAILLFAHNESKKAIYESMEITRSELRTKMNRLRIAMNRFKSQSRD